MNSNQFEKILIDFLNGRIVSGLVVIDHRQDFEYFVKNIKVFDRFKIEYSTLTVEDETTGSLLRFLVVGSDQKIVYSVAGLELNAIYFSGFCSTFMLEYLKTRLRSRNPKIKKYVEFL